MAGRGGSPPEHPDGSSNSKFVADLIKVLPDLGREVKQQFDHHKAEHERKKKEIEIGWLGKLIGDKDHAPSRIAFLAIVFCVVMILGVLTVIAVGNGESQLLYTITTGAISIFTAALGFLFGRGPGRR